MHYGFFAHESLAAGVRRMAGELIDCVIAAVTVPEGAHPDAEAVHAARKALKKLRSLLRLVRKPLGKAFVRREAAFCRDTAHLLSFAREVDVRVATFDGLVHFQSRFSAESIARIRSLLSHTGASAHSRDATLEPAGLRKTFASLHAARARFEAPGEFEKGPWKILRKGLARSYGRAQASFKAAFSAPEPDLLHDCRKRFKDLQYQLELLRGSQASGPIAKAERAAKHVAECLGEHRDLTLLGEYLRGPAREKTHADEIQRLQARIVRRREALLKKACKSARIFLEPEEEVFVRRVGRRWKKARRSE